MKKYVWTQAALLLTLPLCGAWYFWHGYVLIAVALVAAAFAVIVGSQIGARREIRRKQQQLEGTAKKTADTSPSTSTTLANCNLARAVSCPQNFSHISRLYCRR